MGGDFLVSDVIFDGEELAVQNLSAGGGYGILRIRAVGCLFFCRGSSLLGRSCLGGSYFFFDRRIRLQLVLSVETAWGFLSDRERGFWMECSSLR